MSGKRIQVILACSTAWYMLQAAPVQACSCVWPPPGDPSCCWCANGVWVCECSSASNCGGLGWKCVSRRCLTCLVWDSYTIITGDILVPPECVLCTTSGFRDDPGNRIEDWDFAYNGEGGEWTVDDNLTFHWRTDPATGSFNDAHALFTNWTAPPCTGTVDVMLDVDDVTTQGDNACAGYADRNDFAITMYASTDVIVPPDCNEGPESVSLEVDADVGCPWCTSQKTLGGCWDANPGEPFMSGGTWAQYYNCQWVWKVHVMSHVTYGVCLDNFTNICSIDDIDPNDRTEQYLTFVIDKLMHGPDPNANCWQCSQAHEQTHHDVYIESLGRGETALPDDPLTDPIDVNCADAYHCFVVESTHEAALQDKIGSIYDEAWLAAQDAEDDAGEAALLCNQNVASTLCDYAASHGWSIPDCNCCL
jgi:hypothetical protein